MWYPWVVGLILTLLTGCALAYHSLRNFSYSRLEEECRRLGRPERFRVILDQQESTFLALQFWATILLLAFAVLFCGRIGFGAVELKLDDADFWLLLLRYVGFVILTLFLVIVAPWVLSRVGGESALCRLWPVIALARRFTLPLLGSVWVLDRLAHRLTGRGSPEADDAAVLGDEIRTVVDEGQREGVIESDAGQMIHRVMELQHEDVAAIMTPRTEMFCVPVESSLEEARSKLIESGHSRVPVIGESADDILGLLYAKDMLKALEPHRSDNPIPVLRDLLREPVYVPVTTQIPALLELLKRKKVHIAMVLDEYGGVAGLVTMEDILEEIVGEIADEFDDPEHEAILILSPTTAEVDARVHLDDLNERLQYNLPEDGEFDTVGGFVFSQLGRMPSVGEEIAWKQLKFTVLTADKRKINRLRIEMQSESVPASADATSEN
jgi:putative hemolysin